MLNSHLISRTVQVLRTECVAKCSLVHIYDCLGGIYKFNVHLLANTHYSRYHFDRGNFFVFCCYFSSPHVCSSQELRYPCRAKYKMFYSDYIFPIILLLNTFGCFNYYCVRINNINNDSAYNLLYTIDLHLLL